MKFPDHEVEFTLLMPCLNEAETIAVCVTKASGALNRLGIHGEIVVADNGSTDGSQELALEAGAKVVCINDIGYGAALIGGISAAQGRYIIMADADDSYDWSKIDDFVNFLRSGNDIVIGCRLPNGGGTILPGAMPWLHRWVGNPGLSFMGRLMFGCGVTDFHCGMRGFSRSSICRLGLKSPGMEFASEMIVKAALANLKIVQVPITLHPDGRSRAPHLRTFIDGWRHLRFLLIYSPRWLFLWPGITLLLLGGVGLLTMFRWEFKLGSLTFGINTMMLCSMLCLLGMQVISFALFARIFGVREGLLPEDFLLRRICDHIKLEHGLILGLTMSLLALSLLMVAIISWGKHSFGPLTDFFESRLTILSITLLIAGIQTIFASFFLSMLGLPKKGQL